MDTTIRRYIALDRIGSDWSGAFVQLHIVPTSVWTKNTPASLLSVYLIRSHLLEYGGTVANRYDNMTNTTIDRGIDPLTFFDN